MSIKNTNTQINIKFRNLSETKHYLQYINPGSNDGDTTTYNDWVQVGMALHNISSGAHEYMVAWQQWSSEGLKGNEISQMLRETESKWKGFGKGDRKKKVGATRLREMILAQNDIADIESFDGEVAEDTLKIDVRSIGLERCFITDDEIDEIENEEIFTVLEHIIDADKNVLFAAPGVGKTMMFLNILCEVVKNGKTKGGDKFLKGMKGAKILYISEQSKKSLMRQIANFRQYYPDFSAKYIDILNTDQFVIGTGTLSFSQKMEIISESFSGQYDVIVIDTVLGMEGVEDSNATKDVNKGLNIIGSTAEALGAISLAIIHTRKDEDTYLGSVAWAGNPDCLMRMDRDKETNEITISILKSRRFDSPKEIVFDGNDYSLISTSMVSKKLDSKIGKKPADEINKEKIRDALSLGEKMTQKELAVEIGKSQSVVSRVISKMEDVIKRGEYYQLEVNNKNGE